VVGKRRGPPCGMEAGAQITTHKSGQERGAHYWPEGAGVGTGRARREKVFVDGGAGRSAKSRSGGSNRVVRGGASCESKFDIKKKKKKKRLQNQKSLQNTKNKQEKVRKECKKKIMNLQSWWRGWEGKQCRKGGVDAEKGTTQGGGTAWKRGRRQGAGARDMLPLDARVSMGKA